MKKKDEPKRYIHLFPDPQEQIKETEENLEFIENKKKINSLLKENVVINLASYEKPRLKPLPNIQVFNRKEQKQVTWQKIA